MNKKLNNLSLNADKQKQDISLQSWIGETMARQISAFQPNNQFIQKANVWTTDWENPNISAIIGGGDAIWYNWSIDMGQLNLNQLNSFQVEILLRNGEDANGNSTGFEMLTSPGFYRFHGYDIKDLEADPTSDVKNIKLIASFYLEDAVVFIPFQSKLIVQYMPRVNRE